MYRPGPPLADLVDCFWLWDGYPAPAPRERALPSGALDLVINLERDQLHFYTDEQPSSLSELPGVSLSGAHANYFVIGTSPCTRVMGVHFRPGGAFPFLGVPAIDLSGQHASLAALWGNAVPALRDRLLEARTVQARFLLLEDFLLERAQRPLARRPVLRAALSAFEDPNLTSVAEVNGLTGLSAKRLIALFREEVGLTPKTYWRVRRFQGALRSMDRGTRNGAQLAAELGYCDQAHFDREFRAFCGLSPSQYLAGEVERPNHVPLRG